MRGWRENSEDLRPVAQAAVENENSLLICQIECLSINQKRVNSKPSQYIVVQINHIILFASVTNHFLH